MHCPVLPPDDGRLYPGGNVGYRHGQRCKESRPGPGPEFREELETVPPGWSTREGPRADRQRDRRNLRAHGKPHSPSSAVGAAGHIRIGQMARNGERLSLGPFRWASQVTGLNRRTGPTRWPHLSPMTRWYLAAAMTGRCRRGGRKPNPAAARSPIRATSTMTPWLEPQTTSRPAALASAHLEPDDSGIPVVGSVPAKTPKLIARTPLSLQAFDPAEAVQDWRPEAGSDVTHYVGKGASTRTTRTPLRLNMSSASPPRTIRRSRSHG